MIHANFTAEGALEKPDIIGAIFGQTEGLLAEELDVEKAYQMLKARARRDS